MVGRRPPLAVTSEDLDQHVLSFHWDGFDPHLITYDRTARRVDELPLDRLAMLVGSARRCIGTFTERGYRPCPTSREVGRYETCAACCPPGIPVLGCVFEPQCDGDLCDHPELCIRNHYVYLAFFGTKAKVGMTSVSRLRERAVEQGADAVRPLFECRNRREARALEKETSRRFKLPQTVRAEAVARTLTVPPSPTAIAHVEDHYLTRISRWRKPLDEEIIFLDDYPINARPRSLPRAVRVEGPHRGEVMGIKGRYMLFRDRTGGAPSLLDLSDLPTRSVRVLD